MQVKPDGKIIVRAPLFMPNIVIRGFINSHRDWIADKLRRLESASESSAAVSPLTDEELKKLSAEAKRVIKEKVEHYAPIVGVGYGKIYIRHQKTRWGSCSSKGNLNFNCLLMLTNDDVINYVVVHELCHRLEMNHSKRFWAEVERVLPGYKPAQKWLKQNGSTVMMRLPQ